MEAFLKNYKYIDLKDYPGLIDDAAFWFSSNWKIPKEEYLKCMHDYLNDITKYGWYLCLDNNKIIGGLGVIKNDFHDRLDLYPNICAVYVDLNYRRKGIAGKLLNMAVLEMKKNGISPIYLVTDHIGFYERYGFEFYTFVNTSDGKSRLYIHR